MAKQKKRLIAALAAGFALSVLVLGGASLASRSSTATTAGTDNVRVVEDRKPPQRWAIDAAYGRGALSNLRSAIDQLAADNLDEARKGIAVAQSLLGRIETSMRGGVRDTVHREVEKPDLVLIHSEVRVLESADTGNAVEAKLDALRDEIDMTDHEAIVAALETLGVPLTYTRVDLPLSDTIGLVNDALAALDVPNPDLARQTLLSIGDGIRVDTIRIGQGDSPDAG